MFLRAAFLCIKGIILNPSEGKEQTLIDLNGAECYCILMGMFYKAGGNQIQSWYKQLLGAEVCYLFITGLTNAVCVWEGRGQGQGKATEAIGALLPTPSCLKTKNDETFQLNIVGFFLMI